MEHGMQRTSRALRLRSAMPVVGSSYPRTSIELGAKWLDNRHFQAPGGAS